MSLLIPRQPGAVRPNLAEFKLQDLVQVSSLVRQVGDGASDFSQAAQKLAGLCRQVFVDSAGDPALALARVYRTLPFSRLPESLADLVRASVPDPAPNLACLVLCGSAGEEPAWNDVNQSYGHRVIPLVDEESVRNIPMVNRLLSELGVGIRPLVSGSRQLPPRIQSFSVFHVEHAPGSEFIPAQEDFVLAHRIASVVGFGGVLPDRGLFAALLFSRVPIDRPTAEMFSVLATSAKVALLRPSAAEPAFTEAGPPEAGALSPREAALESLLETLEETAVTQASRLELALANLRSAERELVEANQLLEVRVEERTSELRESASELSRSNQELREFASVVSHDLQEPLRMIASYLQMLQRNYSGQLDERADRYINVAVSSAVRMQSLIEDLLAYARTASRQQEHGRVNSEAVIGDVLERLRGSIETAAATVTHDPLPTVTTDRTLIGQLFQNLISNAIKFRGQDPPRIHVAAVPREEFWEFQVADNGIGIPELHRERVFNVFERLHRREKYDGTGMGLAICRKIVERQGGRIWVEGRPEGGALFKFTVPGWKETGNA